MPRAVPRTRTALALGVPGGPKLPGVGSVAASPGPGQARVLGPRFLGPRFLGPRFLGPRMFQPGEGPLVAPLSSALPAWMQFLRASDEGYRALDDAGGERFALAGGDDVPVFHRPFGDSVVGLLVQAVVTNRCQNTEALDDAFYGLGTEGTPILTPNARPAPDGFTTADDLEDDDGANSERRGTLGSLGFANGTEVTCSVYARLLAGLRGQLSYFQGTDWGLSGRAAVESPTWKRVVIPPTIVGNNTNDRLNFAPASADVLPPTAAELGKVSWWGMMAESGKVPHTYVRSAGAPTLKAAGKPTLVIAALGGRVSPDRGDVAWKWRPGHTDAETTVSAALLQLSGAPNTLLTWNATDKKLDLYVGGVRVLQSAALVFGRWTSEFAARWQWSSPTTTVLVTQGGATVLSYSGPWVVPALGPVLFFGTSDSGTPGELGIFYDLVVR